MKTFRGSLTNLTTLLPQLQCKQTNAVTYTALTAETLISAHTTSRTLPTCDISLGPLKLPASEAEEFVKLFLLYKDRGNIVAVGCVTVEC